MLSRCNLILRSNLTFVRSSRFLTNSLLVKNRHNYHNMASIMQDANRLRRVMEEGKGPATGCWQMIPGANVSRTLARTGVDWVLVDCEHGNIDGESLHFGVM